MNVVITQPAPCVLASAEPQSAASFNIAGYLPAMASASPDRVAIVASAREQAGRRIGSSLTFAELNALSNRYANGLTEAGFEGGMRVLLMVRFGIEFVGLVFALFKMGVVPVIIDPGMGISRMLECIRQADLHGFVGIPLAQVMRVMRRRSFAGVRRVVTVGRRWFWGGPTLDRLTQRASPHFTMAHTRANETAAILFTSGSTGPAKGVVYEHGMFDAQVRAIRDSYGIEPGEIDLPTFPLFALFNPALGMTSVIPDMDPSRPGSVDPAKIVEAIREQGVTSSFGSPALWNRVASYCVQHAITLPTMRRVLIAGAPVPYQLIESLFHELSPGAEVHTPYGATESLPVTTIGGREILGDCAAKSRRGEGTCVGRALPDVDVRIIRIMDEPIERWSDELIVPDGEIGEIVVRGPVVTKEYFGLPDATRRSKIRDGDTIRHRIGDVGYRDELGRIWFCGRKAHRVTTENRTQFSVCCEAIFNEHPDVVRSALVGVGPPGRQTPVIVVEPRTGGFPSRTRAAMFRSELLQLGQDNELTRAIRHFLFRRALPMDVRHNAKIRREELAVWAERKLR